MTKEEALTRIKAMRRCLDCSIKGKDINCEDCEKFYLCGTLGEILETYDFIINALGETE